MMKLPKPHKTILAKRARLARMGRCGGTMSHAWQKMACVAVMVCMTLTACHSLPKTKPNQNRELAQIRTAMAAQYIAHGELDQAKRQLDQALLADDKFAPSHDMMGVLLQSHGSDESMALAQQYFAQAIALDDDFMQAHNNYGVYLMRVGQASQAVNHFKKAGDRLGYEGRVSALQNLGFAWQQLGEPQKALQAFENAIHAGSVDLAVYENTIALYIHFGRLSQAKALIEQWQYHHVGQALPNQLAEFAKQVNQVQ